jgi:hypothetical protein
MQQLELPFTTTRSQRALFKAKEILEYARQHPGDVILALLAVMLMDIESDIDQLTDQTTGD